MWGSEEAVEEERAGVAPFELDRCAVGVCLCESACNGRGRGLLSAWAGLGRGAGARGAGRGTGQGTREKKGGKERNGGECVVGSGRLSCFHALCARQRVSQRVGRRGVFFVGTGVRYGQRRRCGERAVLRKVLMKGRSKLLISWFLIDPLLPAVPWFTVLIASCVAYQGIDSAPRSPFRPRGPLLWYDEEEEVR